MQSLILRSSASRSAAITDRRLLRSAFLTSPAVLTDSSALACCAWATKLSRFLLAIAIATSS
ncbi:hypothetical protein [Nostoc sp. NMS8]|uniref:hypothetical protein n=1 Tax=Nostoc sp. NMS8 TaxID=2815392 RepID=UPI0025E1EF54|nr:hypothetical protein [Nostoc sp. NMS8]MBN3962054.1 hypothetical protein [Nostoc sp. NMS8]